MEIVINGKKISFIRTLHITQCNYEAKDGNILNQESCFVIYDELNEEQELETHIMYFGADEIDSVSIK